VPDVTIKQTLHLRHAGLDPASILRRPKNGCRIKSGVTAKD